MEEVCFIVSTINEVDLNPYDPCEPTEDETHIRSVAAHKFKVPTRSSCDYEPKVQPWVATVQEKVKS